jgi:hypothetical protein
MATVQIQCTADGFLNNISGWYGSETFNLSRNTSSSNADECQAFCKFTTVGSGIGATDTINSATFYWYVTSWSDVNFVSQWTFYTDINNVWDASGAWSDAVQPDLGGGITSGTVNSGSIAIGSVGLNNHSISTSIPRANIFSVGIDCGCSDLGPGLMYFDAREAVGSNEPYVIIDYTPVAQGCSPTSYLFGH